MGVERFEVGVRDQAGRMLIRTWSKPEILQHMAWLKRENAKGADVYVRPAGETNAGLVLVDDLNRGQLA
ncbi:DNA-primase RepB domain-containing protein, partial [Xylella fastidiosa]